METSVNNKCKAFTSLEQSKKLAEILPIESADMIWVLANPNLPMIRAIAYKESKKSKYYEVLPSWSLAALLGVLPKRIELEWVAYELSLYLNGLYYWNINNGNLLLEVRGKDNLVDACVAMIEKLHELKIL